MPTKKQNKQSTQSEYKKIYTKYQKSGMNYTQFINSIKNANSQRKYKNALKSFNINAQRPHKQSSKKSKTINYTIQKSKYNNKIKLANKTQLIRELQLQIDFKQMINSKSITAFRDKIKKEIYISFFKRYMNQLRNRTVVSWYSSNSNFYTPNKRKLEIKHHSTTHVLSNKQDIEDLIDGYFDELTDTSDDSDLDLESSNVVFRIILN